MVKVEGSTVIARSPEVVFDFVADERNEPKYNPQMVRAEKVTEGPIAEGTRWSATIMSRRRPLDMQMEITDYSRPSRLETVTSMSTAEIRGALTFRPEGEGTRMAWSWELEPRGVLRLLGPLVARMGRRQEEVIWASLKSYLENSGSSSADDAL
jgi:carbon monoxide dehydrogenase subunit G